MGLFNLREIKEKIEERQEDQTDRSELLRSRFEATHIHKINNIKDLLGDFPKPGQIFFLFTLKSFSAFTFILYIIKHVGRIDELCLSSYSINSRVLASLLRYYDQGNIERINMSLSETIWHRMPRVFEAIQSAQSSRNIYVHYCWNHSKITLIKAGGYHFIIEGSGNFSENAQFEQYIFLNSPEIYGFRRQCILPKLAD